VKVRLEIHEQGTLKKKSLEQLHGLNYLDAKSAAGEAGK
jgi:hypothetical protein